MNKFPESFYTLSFKVIEYFSASYNILTQTIFILWYLFCFGLQIPPIERYRVDQGTKM